MNPFLEKDQPIDIKSRNLPHWHQEGKLQFVTFHLSDSIPEEMQQKIANQRKNWISCNPKPWSREKAAEYRKLFNEQTDNWLDNGFGECILKHHATAKIVADAIEHFNGERYEIIAYVVMPNHVHILARIFNDFNISDICKSWKGYSALSINRYLKRKGSVWHSESWDRMIRNEYHYRNVIEYIKKNINSGGVIWKI